jgi:hypothetical protein
MPPSTSPSTCISSPGNEGHIFLPVKVSLFNDLSFIYLPPPVSSVFSCSLGCAQLLRIVYNNISSTPHPPYYFLPFKFLMIKFPKWRYLCLSSSHGYTCWMARLVDIAHQDHQRCSYLLTQSRLFIFHAVFNNACFWMNPTQLLETLLSLNFQTQVGDLILMIRTSVTYWVLLWGLAVFLHSLSQTVKHSSRGEDW